jgi:hypothetical protein
MWFTQIRATGCHSVSQAKKTGKQSFWQVQNIVFYGLAEKLNGVLHG